MTGIGDRYDVELREAEAREDDDDDDEGSGFLDAIAAILSAANALCVLRSWSRSLSLLRSPQKSSNM